MEPGRRGDAPSAAGTILITGAARSGKSRHALELAAAWPRRAYVATAEAVDAEMAERIRRHRDERGAGFVTVEEPLDPAAALGRLPAGTDVAVVDCLTVWLGNLVHRRAGATALRHPEDLPEVAAFLRRLDDPPCRLVVVTNEVGWGVVPENPLARSFRDLAGRVNEAVAKRCERVVLMVCGRPLELAGGRRG
jgi:adenosylcobinamide kinase/adenosylcobinamide-phosphate guanylyltransferase